MSFTRWRGRQEVRRSWAIVNKQDMMIIDPQGMASRRCRRSSLKKVSKWKSRKSRTTFPRTNPADCCTEERLDKRHFREGSCPKGVEDRKNGNNSSTILSSHCGQWRRRGSFYEVNLTGDQNIDEGSTHKFTAGNLRTRDLGNNLQESDQQWQ